MFQVAKGGFGQQNYRTLGDIRMGSLTPDLLLTVSMSHFKYSRMNSLFYF